jgi:hypothetical protein
MFYGHLENINIAIQLFFNSDLLIIPLLVRNWTTSKPVEYSYFIIL